MKALTNDIKSHLIALGQYMATASDREMINGWSFAAARTAGVIAGLFEGKKEISNADFSAALAPWQQGFESTEAIDEWTPSDRARQFKSLLKARLAAEYFLQVETPVKATTADVERKRAERMASHARKVESTTSTN